jgi:hypothetical protein
MGHEADIVDPVDEIAPPNSLLEIPNCSRE